MQITNLFSAINTYILLCYILYQISHIRIPGNIKHSLPKAIFAWCRLHIFLSNMFMNQCWYMSGLKTTVCWRKLCQYLAVIFYALFQYKDHLSMCHGDVIKWKHFPRYWPFVRGIHRFPVNSPHKGQWREALMFSFICIWINGKADDLRRYRAHYDVTVM